MTGELGDTGLIAGLGWRCPMLQCMQESETVNQSDASHH